MGRIIMIVAALLSCSLFSASLWGANGSSSSSTTRNDFFSTTVAPAMNTVKKAMPPAPQGWVVAGETRIDAAAVPMTGSNTLRFTYEIVYKRVKGVKEEQRRLDNALAESSQRNQEAIKPQLEELIHKQSVISGKLRQATRRKNQTAIRQLNDELDENGKAMMALHDETDRKIAQDVDPYLVRDVEASVRISVNDSRAELAEGKPVQLGDAAFALRCGGERSGAGHWKEGRTLVLYGPWQKEGENIFRAAQPSGTSVKTVKILLTGDPKRVDDLMKQIQLKTILGLMN